MDVTTQLYLAAGLGSLALGGGVLLREPGRKRNRLFALLTAALAAWTLGVFAGRATGDPRWRLVNALGACASAPLALHFVLALTRAAGRTRRWALPAAYGASAVLWGAAWAVGAASRAAWNASAVVVLGTILVASLVALARHGSTLIGPARHASRLLLGAGLVATVAGLSDLVPRSAGIPRLGPLGLLACLLVLSAALVRYRFLDVDAYLARALAILAGAALATFLVLSAQRASGGAAIAVFATLVLVLALAGPVGRRLLAGVRGLLGGDPVAQAIVEASRRLAAAGTHAEAWRALEDGGRALPGDTSVALYVEAVASPSFRARFHSGDAAPPDVDASGALPRLLAAERGPLSRTSLAEDAREAGPHRRAAAAAALAQLDTVPADVVTPLLRGERLVGWIALGGPSARALGGEAAAALLAVGNQAVATFDRLDALEAARRQHALAAVGEMAAGLAHEVRNPLGAISGAAQVLGGRTTPESTREMLDVIEEETARLGRVVGDFLAYARPAPLRREPVDLSRLAESVLRAERLAGSGLHAELHAAPGAPPALGDADQLRGAFSNLVRNAREAAGAAGLLRVEIAPDGPGRVVARFADDGPGIAPEVLARLFQPFASGRPGGTGLGLALVHRVVEAHGGDVRVDSRPGAGTTFTLLLPAAPGGAP